MPTAQAIVSAIRVTVRTAQIMSAICLLAGIVLNFINVIGRYFLQHAIIWAEETMLFLMIASVFLGAGAITLRGAHIRMDLAMQLMSPLVRVALEIVAQATFLVMAAVLIWLAYPVIAQYVAFGQVSDALRLPVAIPHSVVPIGLFIMALATVARLIERKWRLVDGEGSQ
jgi:C4-dicarboxylate transporter DctQ subunit